ncbi:MAG: hypothetical protein K940chlam8_00759 [Chlamydiae bacterium]|nr:hypothetical protein [Chlamydiota bacterium]
MRKPLFVLFCVLLSFAFGNLQNDKKHLEVFFKHLCKNTSAGFVIFGSKPIFEMGYKSFEEDFPPGTYFHQMGTFIRNGMRALEKNPSFCKKIILKRLPSNKNGWHTLIIVNKRNLAKVFQENATIFKSILGKTTTFSSLLKTFKNGDQPLEEIVKGNKLLLGILFGYEVNNSKIVSRVETIDEYLTKKNQYSIFPNKEYKTAQFFKLNVPKKLSPSSNFISFEEERTFLKKQYKITIPEFRLKKPNIPWFGYIPNKTSKKLIFKYLLERQKIISLLTDDNFIDQVIQCL